jgi:hypothetical protein
VKPILSFFLPLTTTIYLPFLLPTFYPLICTFTSRTGGQLSGKLKSRNIFCPSLLPFSLNIIFYMGESIHQEPFPVTETDFQSSTLRHGHYTDWLVSAPSTLDRILFIQNKVKRRAWRKIERSSVIGDGKILDITSDDQLLKDDSISCIASAIKISLYSYYLVFF